MESLSGNKTVPYSKMQARELRQQYCHLEATEYFENGVAIGIIERVSVAPYDDVNKYIFMEYYHDSNDPGRALEFYYAPFYDVILVIRLFNTGKLIFTRAETYTKQFSTP